MRDRRGLPAAEGGFAHRERRGSLEERRGHSPPAAVQTADCKRQGSIDVVYDGHRPDSALDCERDMVKMSSAGRERSFRGFL
jgi:hypothetical protein